jgi:inner membrane protein YhjD
MDWLTKLPLIGPVAAWFFRTRVWRVYRHLDEHKWNRHAASVTFTSFISLFPMLAVFAAVGASLLTPERMRTVQHTIDRQVPGISGKLDLQSLADNAGTIGLIAGLLLVVTGVNWVGTLRESLRALWDLKEDPGNPVVLKLKDLGALVGLGLVGLVSLAASAFAVPAVGWATGQLGVRQDGIGSFLLSAAGYAAAVSADFALLWYVLTVLPGVRPPRGATVLACSMGAVGFELLKLLLGGYLQGVATKSVYGAFGTPIALLLWISFMARLTLFCASWTATEHTRKPIEEIDALGSGASEPVESERAAPVRDEETGESVSRACSHPRDPTPPTDPDRDGPANPPSDRSPPRRRTRTRSRHPNRPDRTPDRTEDGAAGPAPGSATGGERRRPPQPPAPGSRR